MQDNCNCNCIYSFCSIELTKSRNTWSLKAVVGMLVGHTFGFPFCQPLWALTKRLDDIVVADTVAIMELNMVADMEVDNVATVNKDVATITISLP